MTCRHFSSGFKTLLLLTCLFHKRSAFLLLNTFYLQPQSHLKRQCDVRSAFPKSQVPDKSTVLSLVARFREAGSVSDRKRSGRPILLRDVSVENM
jgi:hypothetical protein